MAMGILRGWPLGASMRLDDDGGAREPAGLAAGGVAAPLPWLPRPRLAAEAEEASVARLAAPLPDGVDARETGAEDAAPRLATRGTSGAATWMCTGAPRAWPGLLGEAGGGVEEGTDTM